MDNVLIAVASIVFVVTLYLDILAWSVLRGEQTLSRLQKCLQAAFVLLVPLVGSSIET